MVNFEARTLRKQLQSFLDQARENEEKMRRFNELELRLIGATSMGELVDLVIHQYRDAFRLDTVTLTLLDTEYELTRMLEASGKHLDALPGLRFESEGGRLPLLFPNGLTPHLGPYRAGAHASLFPGQAQEPRSVALLPLVRRGALIGSICLASRGADRFTEESGTDFLPRLAAVVAICLENCANHHRLKQIGLTDPLTRVNNRRYFDQRAGEEVSAAIRHQHPLACMFLDLDYFKRINDTLGHQAGDRVLREVASLIDGQLRHSDTLCRYGGEEFVVLLPDTTEAAAQRIAERIRAEVERHLFQPQEETTLEATLSVGVATLHAHPDDDVEAATTRLIAAADQALYRAKEGGRNRVEVATGEHQPPGALRAAD